MPNLNSLKPPTSGTPISRKNGQLVVPDDPIIPFIEGDGTGPDIWRASVRVFDASAHKAYGPKGVARCWYRAATAPADGAQQCICVRCNSAVGRSSP